MLGELDVPKSTFFRWKAIGKAPRTIKYPSGSLRVRRRDLDAWLAEHEEEARCMTTYDVRVFAILKNKNAKSTTYSVRWVVAGLRFRDTFATRALAESFLSKLLVAQREGVAFDEATGLPEPMARELVTRRGPGGRYVPTAGQPDPE